MREKLRRCVEMAFNAVTDADFDAALNNKPFSYADQIATYTDSLIANGVTIQNWIPVTERLPDNFVSVLGYMTDAGDFPPVRECYTVGNAFFFPALGDIHPVSHWCEMPKLMKEETK